MFDNPISLPIPTSTPTNYATPQQLQQAREMASALMKQGSESGPIYSPWGVAARALQGVSGGWMAGLANQKQLAQRNAQADQIENLSTNPEPQPNFPGVPGVGASSPTMSYAGGSSSDPYEADIRQTATSLGEDPNVAVSVHQHEAGPGQYVGDQGSSFGPFQLHYGKMAPGGNAVAGMGDDFTRDTGEDARDPTTAHDQIVYALTRAKQEGWGAFHGWQGDPYAGISNPGQPATPKSNNLMAFAGTPNPDAVPGIPGVASAFDTARTVDALQGGQGQANGSPYAGYMHMIAEGVRNGSIDPQIGLMQAMQLRQQMVPQYSVNEYGQVIMQAPGQMPRIVPGAQIGMGKQTDIAGVPFFITPQGLRPAAAAGGGALQQQPNATPATPAPANAPTASPAPQPQAPKAAPASPVASPAAAAPAASDDQKPITDLVPMPENSHTTVGMMPPPVPQPGENPMDYVAKVQTWKATNEASAEGGKEAAKSNSKAYAEKQQQINNNADEAQQTLPQLKILYQAMHDQNFYSGLLSGDIAKGDQALHAMGITDGNAANLYALAKKLGTASSLAMISKQGQEAGAVRVPEMNMIEKSNYDPENPVGANIAVVDTRMRQYQRALDIKDMADKYTSDPNHSGQLDNNFFTWTKQTFAKRPLFKDKEIENYNALFDNNGKPKEQSTAPTPGAAGGQPNYVTLNNKKYYKDSAGWHEAP